MKNVSKYEMLSKVSVSEQVDLAKVLGKWNSNVQLLHSGMYQMALQRIHTKQGGHLDHL